MATIRAAANGNWSAGATWIGGVVPTSADDVVANSFTIQVDSNYTVLSVRNDTLGGSTAGGTFVLNNSSSLTCTATNGIVVGSSTPTITFNLPIGQSSTISANVPTITAITNYHAVLLAGLGTLNFIGNASCTTSASNLRIINITVAGTLNFIGNPTNGGTTVNQCNTIYSSAAASINITGSFSGGSFNTQNNASVFMNNGGNITVTGNISGASSPAITINQGNVVVIGNVTGSIIEAIRNITNATPLMDITGIVTAGSGSPAITCLGLVKLSGIAVNNNRYIAIYSPQITIENTTISWRFQEFAGADITLYAPSASLGNPIQADVRFGTTYGPSGTLIGTLRVPNPNTVLLGNLTDNTIGTLLMTPQQFWEALTSAVTLVGSFGKLIKDFLNAAVGSIPTNPLLTTDTRLNNLDATISSRMETFTYTAPDNASIIAIKLKTDTILWSDIVNIKTKTDTIVWSDVTGLVSTAGDIKTKTDTIDWTDIVSIKAKTDTIDWADITSVTTSISGLETDIANIPTNPVLDTDSRLDYLDAPISGAGGSVDLTPVLDALVPIADDVSRIPDFPASVQSTGEQIASYQT